MTSSAARPATDSPATEASALLKSGAVFDFHGLDRDPTDGRFVKLHSISVSGRVNFAIGFMGEQSQGLHDAALGDVLAMIDAGIWVAQEPPQSDPAD